MSKIKEPYFNLYKSGKEGSYYSKNLKKIIKTHLPKSICSKCGAKECHKFWKKFTPVSWFRGDDEYDGIYCDDCRKEEELLTKTERN